MHRPECLDKQKPSKSNGKYLAPFISWGTEFKRRKADLCVTQLCVTISKLYK